HRALLLTDAGQVLQSTARSILDDLNQAVARIRRDQTAQPITLSTAIPFAPLWLLPRLPRFRQPHPWCVIVISAYHRIRDLPRDRESIDVAVLYRPEAQARPGAHRLFGARLQPVCIPSLASDPARPLKEPQDLARHVLLHMDDERGRFPWLTWAQWFAAIG